MHMDGLHGLLMWSDTELYQINFYRYSGLINNTVGVIYEPTQTANVNWNPIIPVGLTIDNGMGAPRFTDYLDCYGHGTCLGVAGSVCVLMGINALVQFDNSLFRYVYRTVVCHHDKEVAL